MRLSVIHCIGAFLIVQKLSNRAHRFRVFGDKLFSTLPAFTQIPNEEALRSFIMPLLEWHRFHSDEDDKEDIPQSLRHDKYKELAIEASVQAKVVAAAAAATAAASADPSTVTAPMYEVGAGKFNDHGQSLLAHQLTCRYRYRHKWRSQLATVVLHTLDLLDSACISTIPIPASLADPLPPKHCEILLSDVKYSALINKSVLQQFLSQHEDLMSTNSTSNVNFATGKPTASSHTPARSSSTTASVWPTRKQQWAMQVDRQRLTFLCLSLSVSLSVSVCVLLPVVSVSVCFCSFSVCSCFHLCPSACY